MQRLHITDNGVFKAGDTGRSDSDGAWVMSEFFLSWVDNDNSAAGVTLRVFTTNEGLRTPVPDTQVTIGEPDEVDDNVRQQMLCQSKGEIEIEISGATAQLDLDVVVS